MRFSAIFCGYERLPAPLTYRTSAHAAGPAAFRGGESWRRVLSAALRIRGGRVSRCQGAIAIAGRSSLSAAAALCCLRVGCGAVERTRGDDVPRGVRTVFARLRRRTPARADHGLARRRRAVARNRRAVVLRGDSTLAPQPGERYVVRTRLWRAPRGEFVRPSDAVARFRRPDIPLGAAGALAPDAAAGRTACRGGGNACAAWGSLGARTPSVRRWLRATAAD